jgi:hypothetical protein
MEKVLDLTHLLNEDCEPQSFEIVGRIFELDPDLPYSFNVHDSGLSLVVDQG